MSEHMPRCPTCAGSVNLVELESGEVAGEHCNLCGRNWVDYDAEAQRAARWRNARGMPRLARHVLFPNPPQRGLP